MTFLAIYNTGISDTNSPGFQTGSPADMLDTLYLIPVAICPNKALW
jgi:hypothetical protein